jgi:hypothetical protein
MRRLSWFLALKRPPLFSALSAGNSSDGVSTLTQSIPHSITAPIKADLKQTSKNSITLGGEQ